LHDCRFVLAPQVGGPDVEVGRFQLVEIGQHPQVCPEVYAIISGYAQTTTRLAEQFGKREGALQRNSYKHLAKLQLNASLR